MEDRETFVAGEGDRRLKRRNTRDADIREMCIEGGGGEKME